MQNKTWFNSLITVFLISNYTVIAQNDPTLIDIDGNMYKTVTIGNQVWMAENLKVTHYRNGDSIPNVTVNSSWSRLTTGAWCNYNNDKDYADKYGKLYNWFAVDDDRKLAPEGWHIPTDSEWRILTDYLGGTNVAGGKMKETGTTHWGTPNTDANNESGFTALPGGSRSYFYGSNFFGAEGGDGNWWSASERDANGAWYRYVYFSAAVVVRSTDAADLHKKNGYSVRCIKDDSKTTGFLEKNNLPESFSLQQNYPNPFNPETIIKYSLPVSSKVELKVFDLLGREVALLVAKEQSAGKYEVKFEGNNLSSGIYFYILKTGDFTAAKKMLLMK